MKQESMQQAVETVRLLFTVMDDPRREQGKRHKLPEVMFMALMGVLSGCNSWDEVEAFCEEQQDWLEQFFTLKHGVPSRSTFQRVFEVLDPKALLVCLTELIEMMRPPKSRDKVIAIDGKRLRRSFDSASQKSALHLLQAFGTDSGLVLGQEAVKEGENEISAMPRLLSCLDVRGRTITADAMHCQKEVAKDIRARKGDYVLCLKKNQGTLYTHVESHFAFAERMGFDKTRMGNSLGHRHYRSTEGGHGRIEERRVDALDATGDWFHKAHPGWESVQSIVRVTAYRHIGMETSEQSRYFLSSHPTEQEQVIASSIRAHWSIENNLHWSLDTGFDEDLSRIRKGHGAQNFAVLRRVVLGLVRQDKTSKRSLKTRRSIAGWKPSYRLKLLGFT